MLVFLGAILFAMGFVKTELFIRLSNGNPAEYQPRLVQWDNGNNSVPDTFSNYIVLDEEFTENGTAKIKLEVGKYDLWLSRDGVSGYSKEILNTSFLNGFLGAKAEINTGSVDLGSILVAHLTIRGGADAPLTVTDENGQALRCTRLGSEDQYVLLLREGSSRIRQVTVTMEGMAPENVTLDFTSDRFIENTVRLSSN